MIPLNLSEDELTRISKTSRDRKFNYTKATIYENNHMDLINNFINCYKFLQNVSNDLGISDVEIRKKILEYLDDKRNIYLNCQSFFHRMNSNSGYSKFLNNRKLSEFVLSNINEIEDFINTAFPIGRIVSLYDPDEAVGIT